MRWSLLGKISLLALAVTACADDVEGDAPTCVAGEAFDQVRGECVPQRSTAGPSSPDASSPDGGVEGDVGESDAGSDCDSVEVCDDLDNDCDGEINDGIECVFYAHSSRALYAIDPFAKTATEVGSADVSAVDALFDIDTAPDGTLYGIAGRYLYSYDPSSGEWTRFDDPLGADISNANGMAIDNAGKAYITSSNRLFTADLSTGHGTAVGQTSGYSSSGDAVVTKGNVLYMTATPSSALGTSDRLVKIDGTSAQVTPVGEIGFAEVWGLTAAWDQLYGLTSAGELITIDARTGAGTYVHRFEEIGFYGAASTPAR